MRSVRVFYEKVGDMKFISHLDINRFMIRMIRISKIPVWYSEGFNPHPYIAFALPLSLGFESSYEIMDIRLDDDIFSNESVFNALNSVMPEGIKILKVTDPDMKFSDISSAVFCITFNSFDDVVASKLNNFLNNETILTEKKSKKGKLNTIDIKEMIYGYNIKENKLFLNLAAGGNVNLNPKLLLETFLKSENLDLSYNIKKVMVYGKNNMEFI